MKRKIVSILGLVGVATLVSCGDDIENGRRSDRGDTAEVVGQQDAWLGAELLHEISGYSDTPQVAVDAAGNALAVWNHRGDSQPAYELWAKRFEVGSGWQSPIPIIRSDEQISNVQLVAHKNGDALVVWQEGISWEDRNVSVSRFEAATGWSEPLILASGDTDGFVESPQAALDAQGHALIAWRYRGLASDQSSLWMSFYDPDYGWQPSGPVSAGSLTADVNGPFDVALNAAGTALVVWSGGTDTAQVWGQRGAPFMGSLGSIQWDAAHLLGTFSTPVANLWARVASSGATHAIWAYGDGQSQLSVATSRATPDVGWEASQVIATGIPAWEFGYPLDQPKLAASSADTMLLTWREADEQSAKLVAKRFVATDWGAPETVADGLTPASPYMGSTIPDYFGQFDVALDNDRALAVWEEPNSEGQMQIWANHRTVQGGWQRATQLDAAGGAATTDTHYAESPSTSFMYGTGLAVWIQQEELSSGQWVQRVWCNRLQED